jgi:hypothetical protein
MNKLYFYENKIDFDFIFKYHTFINNECRNFIVLTGENGYNKTLVKLKEIDNHIVYSNYPCILNSFYNKKTEQHEVYIMIDNKPVHIQYLTDKQIREENNIENIYKNGGFSIK